MTWTVHHGDNRDIMRAMPAECMDSIVTDPPYGLGFMGKGWDHGVPGVEYWAEAFRVAKPGAYLLAFGGSRAYHRLAVAIEDAGWELKDSIASIHESGGAGDCPWLMAWVYGSGFPKSRNISKDIDAMDAAQLRIDRQLRFTEWMRSTGLTSTRIDLITGTCMGGHYTTAASQPSVATREHFEMLRPHFGCDVPAWVEQLVNERTVESENTKRREVIGIRPNAASGWDMDGGTQYSDREITAAHTEAAKAWEGWGTALKPAWEPIIMARKPHRGSIARNVLKHGTGALNIKASEVPLTGDSDAAAFANNHAVTERIPTARAGQPIGMFGGGWKQLTGEAQVPDGRWPANVVHDGSAEVLAHFPQDAGASSPVRGTEPSAASTGRVTGERARAPGNFFDDAGSAARFFYCAKASSIDRDEGCEAFDLKAGGIKNDSGRGYSEAAPHREVLQRNHHPTVKPTALMRYFVRMITPPGGKVLDLFAGSGSTGKAAILEGFDVELIEADFDNAGYIDIIKARCTHAEKLYRAMQHMTLDEAREALAAAKVAAEKQHDLFGSPA